MSALGDRLQRRRLGEELRRLRDLAGLSGAEIGAAVGVSQSTVSRIERGELGITLAQIVSWAEAASATEDQRERLLAVAQGTLTGPTSWEAASATGSSNLAAETAELEARTRLLSNYQPAAIPGLLQTPAYAQRLLSSGPAGVPLDLGERLVGRIERQRVLSNTGHRFRFVIPEAVLRWPYGPPGDPAVLDEHREQLAKVSAAVSRPNIEVGILPLAPLDKWRLAGFVIFDQVEGDEPSVHLEWLTRPFNITDPGQVEECRVAFGNLLAASLTGADAEAVIQQVLRDL